MNDWVSKRGSTVVDKQRLRSLTERSNFRGAIQTLSHAGAIGVSGALLALSWGSWIAVPIFIIHGILINCLYAGQHELSHWTVFKKRSLNDHVGRLFGFVTLNPFSADRWAHFTHHRYTQDPEKDSDLLGMPPYTLTSYILDLSGISFWYRRFRSIGATAIGPAPADAFWLTESQRRTVVVEARWHVAGYCSILAASLALGSAEALYYWLAPMLATKWFHQLQNTGEHVGLSHEPDTFRNTRTLTGSPVMRWLMWNMSYHTAHHSFPGVPFHALPQLHAEIVKKLGSVPSASYLEAQAEIFAQLWGSRASSEPRHS
jgi:fatty acid desaturase